MKSQVRDGELVTLMQTPSPASSLRAEMEKNSPAVGELKPANAKAPSTKASGIPFSMDHLFGNIFKAARY